jgi:CheY-like chemotaxis protein
VFVFRIEAGALDSPLEHPELGRTRPEEWSSGDAATYLDGVRVLLTESGDDVERLARHFLVRAGAIVACASDGAEAVRRVLLAETEGEPFDVVFMDMEMAIVDGYEGTRRLRASGYVRPIVALSQSTLACDAEACRTAGCDDFLSKPLRSSELLAAAARWARQEDNRQPMRSVPPPPLPSKAPEADEELVALVREFLTEMEGELSEMRKALTTSDRARVATLAHRLMGAAGSYGFPEITRQAADVEAAVQAEFEAADIEREIAALDALCKSAAAAAGVGAPFPARGASPAEHAAPRGVSADGGSAAGAAPSNAGS